MNSKIFLIPLIIIQILNHNTLFGQKYFSNLKSTPDRWHEQSLSNLRSINYEFERKKEKTKTDSVVYFSNLAGLYANLGESSDTVFYYLDKSLFIDKEFGCLLLIGSDKIMRNSNNGMYFGKLDPQRYMIRKVKCENYLNSLPKEKDDVIKSNPNYDQQMITLIEIMFERDQKYRFNNQMDKQRTLDERNRMLLDSIFSNYGYPGKSKVSDVYSIQVATIFLHMGLEFMEKWMPLLIKTFKSGDLDNGSIMYALDRLHTLKYERQFFGTQRISKGGEMINVTRYSVQEQMKILRELDLPELFNDVRE